MAKKSTDEYLADILKSLDEILKENKKSAKSQGQSNVPAGAGIIQIDAKNIEVLGNSLKVLSSAIVPLAKISKKQFEDIADGIKILGDAIRNFGLNKEAFQGISDMLIAFVQIHQVITGLADNFIKSILKLNPRKGRLIGRALGAFYGNVLKGMRNGFVKYMVDAFKLVPSKTEDPEFKSRIVNFGLMTAELLLITKEKVMQLWFMGVMLGPRIGKAIGGFFRKLVSELTYKDPTGARAAAAAKVAFSISTLIGVLSLSLVALVLLSKNASGKDLGIGIGMLIGVVIFAFGIIKTLSLPFFRHSAEEGIKETKQILALIGGLTLSLVALVLISKNIEWPEIGKGAAMLGGIIVITIGLMFGLRIIKEKTPDAMEGVVGILTLIGGLTIVAMISIALGKYWKDVLVGMGLVLGVTLASIGLFALLSLLPKSKVESGLIAVGGIILLVGGVSIAMMLFAGVVRMLKDVKKGDIWNTFGLTMAMVVGMGALAFAAGALVAGPQALLFAAGFAAIESITIMIASVSGAMLMFAKLVKTVNEDLTQTTINSAIDMILGKGENKGMVGAIKDIVNGLNDIGFWSSVKAKLITKNLNPIFKTISKFMDIIKKTANMQIFDPETGKFRKMETKDFTDAATAISDSFKIFVTTMSSGFMGIKEGVHLKMLLDFLYGSQSLGSKLIFGRRATINDLLKTISRFVDVIIRMASKRIPTKWDSNGNPIEFKTLTDTDFTNAATSVVNCFNQFLISMSEKISGDVAKNAGDVIEKLSKGDINSVLSAIGNVITPILQIASGKIQIGDKVETLPDNLTPATGKLFDVFETIITRLGKLIDINISNRKANNILGVINKTIETFTNLINSKLITTEFINNVKNFRSGLQELTNYFQSTTDINNASKNSKRFKEMMENTKDGLKTISPFLKSTPEQLRDIAKAFRELDIELIDKEQKRTEAIQTISSNFKNMADNVEKLNTTLKESSDIMNKYNNMRSISDLIQAKGAAAVVYATEKVNTTIKNVEEHTKQIVSSENVEKKEEKNNTQMQALGQYIANAITVALNEWSNQNKELTVKFDQSPRALFGNLEIG